MNSTDEEALKKGEREAEKARQLEMDDVKFLVATPQGQRFVRRVFAKWGLYRNAMTGNSMTYFHLGTQNVAQWLLEEVRIVSTKAQLAEIMFITEEESSDDSNTRNS